MYVNEKNRQQLRKMVVRKFGKEITSNPECISLSKQLSELGFCVTAQTLRRYFGVIEYDGGFNTFTHDAFAKYCGYGNFEEFKHQQTEYELDAFFDSVDSENKLQDYWQMSNALCKKIIDSPELLVKIHHQLLKYPLARTFFIEHHPMRDFACTVYAQYFQEYLKFNHSNEAKIFAYGFLFMGSFLGGNNEFMKIYHDRIADTELTDDVYVLPAGRKFGVPLLYLWLTNDEATFAEVYADMLEAREIYKDASEKSVCSFEYSVLEHLIFTDKTEEMKFLIEHNTFQKYSDREFVPDDRKENHDEVWKILCAVAYLKMHDYKICEQYLNAVNLEKLALGWNKYYSILYYFVKHEFAEEQEKLEIRKKLGDLIGDTHFSYYEPMLAGLI